jgi:hypothetical protein
VGREMSAGKKRIISPENQLEQDKVSNEGENWKIKDNILDNRNSNGVSNNISNAYATKTVQIMRSSCDSCYKPQRNSFQKTGTSVQRPFTTSTQR